MFKLKKSTQSNLLIILSIALLLLLTSKLMYSYGKKEGMEDAMTEECQALLQNGIKVVGDETQTKNNKKYWSEECMGRKGEKGSYKDAKQSLKAAADDKQALEMECRTLMKDGKKGMRKITKGERKERWKELRDSYKDMNCASVFNGERFKQRWRGMKGRRLNKEARLNKAGSV